MSTTVNYKGDTIATLTNQTKTLDTAGTWLEDDIEIIDVSESGSAVVVEDTTDSGGGTIRTITAVDLSSDTVTPSVLLSGFTAHNCSGSAITGTLTQTDTNFIIIVSYDSEEEKWIPDKTFTEISSAYQANKVIALKTNTDTAVADGWFNTGNNSDPYLAYTVYYQSGNDRIEEVYSYWDDGSVVMVSQDSVIIPDFCSPTATYTPTESQQTDVITYDPNDGYNGIEEVHVTVNAISSSYVGSGVTQRTSSDLSASGATITAPSGYYASSATKTITSGSATPASTISGTSATVSTGTNTLTLSKTVSNTPQVSAGYISSGTAGNSSVSLTASVTTQAAQTIYPSSSDQTINSGRYLTGTQTIKGVTTSNLTADNIKSGVTVTVGDSSDPDRVASVTGTYSGGGGGGATNFVTGTFTTGSSTSTNETVSVPYTGSGYPTMLVIVVEGGMYNSNVSGWYNSLTRYAVGQITIGKGVSTSAPTYSTSGSANYGSVELIYKNSTSTATNYSSTRSANANSYSSSNANGTSTTCVRWTANTTISYRTCGGGSSSYGLLAGTTYRYYACYSS